MTRSKADWRRFLLGARASIPESARRVASDAIVARLRQLRCVQEARVILGYVPIGAEADPMGFLAAARQKSIRVLVPFAKSEVDAPSWVALGTSERLEDLALGSMVESGSTVAIVPGVGFDQSGTRLGRGAGFYDRALVQLRSVGSVVAVGIGFDVQIVASLPRDEWDQPMDFVVSEIRVVGQPTASNGTFCV